MKTTPLLLICLLLGAGSQTHATAAVPSGTGPLPLTEVLGGSVLDPVILGDLVHVPSGRIVSTWDYSDPAAPVLLGSTSRTPVNGVIRGLTHWGDYLYASWQSPDDSGGVAVYSLRDPRRPELVNQFSDYAPSFKVLWTLAAANGYLYLFDAENGIYYGDLDADPLHPTFTRLQHTPVPYDRSTLIGDQLYISGSTFDSVPVRVCHVLDVTTPSAPVLMPGNCGNGDPIDLFRHRPQLPLMAAFGVKLSLFDLANPNGGQALASIDIEPATDGFIAGQYAYSLGFAGIDIHDISNPQAPVTVAHSTIPTLGADSVTPIPGGALVLTSTDRFTGLDVSNPLQPVAVASVTPPAGAVAGDIALADGKAVILQENYGLGVAERDTLEPLARFDADLPEALNRRAFEQFAVDAGRAYLVSWGYGLIVVDLANPMQPVELGRVPYSFPSAVAASGDFVYMGTSTNGGILQVVDVSDPAQPVLRGTSTVPSVVNRLQVHGNYVYAADELSGIHVFDVSDPDAPVRVALWSNGCTNALGYFARDIELNADGTLAVVACASGLQVLDLSQPASPVHVGGHVIDYWNNLPTVALRGNRAWYGDERGVKEYDISTPATPVLLGETPVAGFSPRRLRALEDGHLFAFTYQAGVHVFGSAPAGPQIFSDGFEGDAPVGNVSHYDDLAEGFLGTSHYYNGVTYHEVNGIGGVFPDGDTFTPQDVGDLLVIEDASLLYESFPDFGSAPNVLTFGTSYIDGPNLSLGPLVRVRLDLDEPAKEASVELAYYEKGPWGGIVLTLEAWRDGQLVGTDQLVIASGDERDNLATAMLSVDAAEIDALTLRATYNGSPTAPRVMIDNLRLVPAR